MKKIFLLFSIAVFLYLFTGCLEETSLFNNIPDKFQGFSGTYKVTFFGSEFIRENIVSNAELLNTYNDYYVTNNCRKLRSFSLILSIKMEKINVMNLRKLIY